MLKTEDAERGNESSGIGPCSVVSSTKTITHARAYAHTPVKAVLAGEAAVRLSGGWGGGQGSWQ